MMSISVKDLWWRYTEEPDAPWILKGVNLDVQAGEFLVITGPNESGKTTLCLCLNALIPHNFLGMIKGRVEVEGLDTMEHRPAELASKVGTVFQDRTANS